MGQASALLLKRLSLPDHNMKDSDTSLIERLRELDESRPSLPGEHWMALGLGLYFLMRRRQTLPGRLASTVAGVALVTRALSGRDGAIAVLRGCVKNR